MEQLSKPVPPPDVVFARGDALYAAHLNRLFSAVEALRHEEEIKLMVAVPGSLSKPALTLTQDIPAKLPTEPRVKLRKL